MDEFQDIELRGGPMDGLRFSVRRDVEKIAELVRVTTTDDVVHQYERVAPDAADYVGVVDPEPAKP